MRLNKLLQKDYTLSSLYYQIKLPLDVEILIPVDDPVRLLSAFVEGMELGDLYQTYRKIKKNQAKLFDKILVLVKSAKIFMVSPLYVAVKKKILILMTLTCKIM